MPFYAYDQYPGNGSTDTYSITFPYIATTDIVVTLDDVVTTAFTFLSSTQIQFDSPPGAGVTIGIKRQTTRGSRNVDFEDGSALPESDLDGNANQMFYIMQELLDDFSTNLSLATDGKWNADSNVIKNLANGSNTNDAINYGQLVAASLGASPLISIETPGAGDAGKVSVVNSSEDGYEVGSVTLGDLAELDTVDTAQIDDDAVTTAKILDANVTNAKLADDAVDSDEIADGAVDLVHLADLSSDVLVGSNGTTPSEITVGSGLDLTSGTLTATGGGSFTSSGQTITTGGTLTIPHSLGAEPSRIRLILEFTTAQHGYAIGDKVDLSATADQKALAASQYFGAGVWFDATNVYIQYGNNAQVFSVYARTGTPGSPASVTNSNAQLIVEAYE